MGLIPEQLIITAISLLFFPVVGVLFLTIVLASAGKSLGIRRFYVSLLLKIFEVSDLKNEVEQTTRGVVLVHCLKGCKDLCSVCTTA